MKLWYPTRRTVKKVQWIQVKLFLMISQAPYPISARESSSLLEMIEDQFYLRRLSFHMKTFFIFCGLVTSIQWSTRKLHMESSSQKYTSWIEYFHELCQRQTIKLCVARFLGAYTSAASKQVSALIWRASVDNNAGLMNGLCTQNPQNASPSRPKFQAAHVQSFAKTQCGRPSTSTP